MDKDIKPDDSTHEAPEQKPVDLSALRNFDFGTNWSDSKSSSRGSGPSDRRPSKGGPAQGDRPTRKDRRPFKPGSFRKGKPGEPGERSQRSHAGGQEAGSGRKPFFRPEVPRTVVEVSFYPEDNGFKALCKALRVSTITYELFEIARTVLEKEERFYVVVRPVEAPSTSGEPSGNVLYVAQSDGLPFLDESAAMQHALADCLDYFFRPETREVEAPTGSFNSIQKCGITGELLGPPNYHRIKKILLDHHASRLSNMPYAKFESRIESVKDEEVIAAWLEKMKTQTTYTLKPEFGEAREFEDGETARAFAKANLSGKMVNKLPSVRLEGNQISKVRDPLIKANLEFAWERQKRFPLDTANLLRGRLRRQKFALYKRGAKGVAFVCAVKRRFRDPGQLFADNVQKLIEFLETNPHVSVKDLPEKFLGIATHAQEGTDQPVLTPEQEGKIKALNMDFQWLLKEGYISEFSDGTVIAHPMTVTAKAPATEKTVVSKEAVSGSESSLSVETTHASSDSAEPAPTAEKMVDTNIPGASSVAGQAGSVTETPPLVEETAVSETSNKNLETAVQSEAGPESEDAGNKPDPVNEASIGTVETADDLRVSEQSESEPDSNEANQVDAPEKTDELTKEISREPAADTSGSSEDAEAESPSEEKATAVNKQASANDSDDPSESPKQELKAPAKN